MLNQDFSHVHTYCMFLCNPKSGHSLVGSLLDAHPEVVVAHEFHALDFIAANNPDRDQLFQGICSSSFHFSVAGRRWHGYNYHIPRQWNGRCQTLQVIGDKKGGDSVDLLRNQPKLLSRLSEIVQVPVKIFQVTRNPFDNIVSLGTGFHNGNIDMAIKAYFNRCHAIDKIRKSYNANNWLEVRYETLLLEPEKTLKKICAFVGVEPSEEYLCDCREVLFKEPIARRHDKEWTQPQIDRVYEQCRQYDWFADYDY